MEINKLKEKRKTFIKESINLKTNIPNLDMVRKKLLVEAKIAYHEGKFSSLYEARKSVPSVKRLREFMEATNATECEHNRVLWATSEEIQEYLA